MWKFLLGALAVSVQSYFVEIDAHKEECFHEKVSSGTKVIQFLIKNRNFCNSSNRRLFFNDSTQKFIKAKI